MAWPPVAVAGTRLMATRGTRTLALVPGAAHGSGLCVLVEVRRAFSGRTVGRSLLVARLTQNDGIVEAIASIPTPMMDLKISRSRTAGHSVPPLDPVAR